jgi:sialate O-acetylesterase
MQVRRLPSYVHLSFLPFPLILQMTVIDVFNGSTEAQRANNYPNIRVFTVGQGTQSSTPLTSLKTITQPWAVASNLSIGGPGWAYFSATCWFFGRTISDAIKKDTAVPLGLISNNWGGTPIQHWSSPEALTACHTGADSVLWNAMMVPYTVGPMAVKGFTWCEHIFSAFYAAGTRARPTWAKQTTTPVRSKP